jgi:hypothetical protein
VPDFLGEPVRGTRPRNLSVLEQVNGIRVTERKGDVLLRDEQ